MKLFNYYLAAFLPLLIVLLLFKLGFNIPFLVLLLLYYIYRCILDYIKLKNNKVVNKKDIWKFIVPIWTFLYFEELYFK